MVGASEVRSNESLRSPSTADAEAYRNERMIVAEFRMLGLKRRAGEQREQTAKKNLNEERK